VPVEGNEPSPGPDLDSGEINGGQNILMGSQECMPGGLTFSSRRRLEAVFSEDISDG
jgi:hypothetical protein